MSDGWHPISDDGLRMVAMQFGGYAIYKAEEPIDPHATSRRFRWCGSVPEFVHAEQWLADGEILGATVDVPVTPAKAKRGQSTGV